MSPKPSVTMNRPKKLFRKGRRVRRLIVTSEVADAFFVNPNYYKIKEGLPDDAVMVSCHVESERDALCLVFESEQWKPVVEGEVIPEIEMKFEYMNCIECGAKLMQDVKDDVKYCSGCNMIYK